jgi:hypothetical protein
MRALRWVFLGVLLLLLSCTPITSKPKERITVVWESTRETGLTTVQKQTTTQNITCVPKLPPLLVLPPPPYLSNACEHDQTCVQETLFVHIKAITTAVKKYQIDYLAAVAACQ